VKALPINIRAEFVISALIILGIVKKICNQKTIVNAENVNLLHKMAINHDDGN